MNRRQRRLGRASDDEGLGLIEAIVSLTIASMVLLALLSSSVFALRATVDARKNQQATDYLNEAIESGRSLDYGALDMNVDDLPTAPQLDSAGGSYSFDPGTGSEPVSASNGGQITPPEQTLTTDNGDYVLRRWVTVPVTATFDAGGFPSVKRLTVEIEWVTKGETHTRRSTTLVTRTRRGLPLPNYTFTYNGPAPVVSNEPHWTLNPGGDVSIGLVVTNLGARDSWTIAADTAGWSFYVDADRDGVWSGDTTTEPLVNPANTGLIEPSSEPVYLVAHRTTSSNDSKTTYTTTFSATSDAQPTYPAKTVVGHYTLQDGIVTPPTPTPTPTTTPTSTPLPCNPGTSTGVSDPGTRPAATTTGGHTLIALYAYNGTAKEDTATLASNTLGKDASVLYDGPCNWSTDQQTDQAGRYLASSGVAPVGKARWSFQPGSGAEDQVRGTAVMVLYVQCVSAGTPTLSVQFAKDGATALGSGSAAVTACPTTDFARVDVPVDIAGNGVTIGIGGTLDVAVTTDAPVRLLYGATTGASRLVVGVK